MTLFEKYSYKQKNLALLVLAVLLFAAAYKRSSVQRSKRMPISASWN
jgi:hypothetical protein